jgi:hypothetical protein
LTARLARLALILLAVFLWSLPVFVVAPGAQTSPVPGIVCIEPGSVTVCPPGPAVVRGQLGSQISVAVNLVNSTIFNDFDISVKADPAIISATGFDLSGSVLTSPTVRTACLNGKFLAGVIGCGAQDGLGVAHLAAAAGCAGVTLACGWSAGPLFKINYKVLGNTTGIPILFQSGCSGGSNSTSCVVIQWITADIVCCPPPNPVNLQTATFVTSPIGIPVQATVVLGLLTATITGDILLNSTARTVSGSLSVTVVNSTSGQTIFSNTFTILQTKFYGSNPMFIFVLSIPVAPITLGAIASVNSLTRQVSFELVRSPDITNRGLVDIVDVSYVFFDFGAIIGSPTYRPQSDLDADGIVGIIDISLITYSFDAPVFSHI